MLKPGDILSLNEICMIEGKGSLQEGISFRKEKPHSIVLMSQRKDAPYPDRLSEDGRTLYYIGHNKYINDPVKFRIDQPLIKENGNLTPNGQLFKAAEEVRQGLRRELVRVYEKLKSGIWVFNGLFELKDAKMEEGRWSDYTGAGTRKVCVFELRMVEGPVDIEEEDRNVSTSPGRLIPPEVKLIVYKRDKGMCAKEGCGNTKNLHFDHIIPWSKGGSSTDPKNIQLLCQRHNLEKRDRIE